MTRLKRLALFTMAICMLLTVRGRADDDAGHAPGVVARVGVGSQTQLASVAKELGISVPAMLTPEGIDQMFPFLGDGGLNPDLPVAVDFLTGGAVTQQQRAIFYLPVNDGHAPLSDFLKTGEKLGDDGAIVNNTPFRRTGGYLLFGGTPETIVDCKPDAVVKQFADLPLLYAEYDAKKMLEVMPDAKEKFKASLPKTAKNQSEQAGQDLVYDAMFDSFDKLVLRLDQKPGAFRLTTQIVPAPKLTQKTWDLPAMPDGLVARLDYQAGDGWIKNGLAWMRQKMGDGEMFASLKDATPAKKDQFMDLLNELFEAGLGGDQTSAAVAVSDGQIVGYVITQSAKPRDFHAEWTSIEEGAKQFPSTGDDKSDTIVSTYKTAAGDSITRVVFTGNDTKPVFQVDVCDRGNVRYEAFSKPDVSVIEKLLASKGEEKLSVSASGYLSVPRLMEMLPLLPNSRMGNLTDDDKKLLSKAAGDSRIQFSVSNAADRLNIATDIPVALIKSLIANAQDLAELAQRMSQGGN